MTDAHGPPRAGRRGRSGLSRGPAGRPRAPAARDHRSRRPAGAQPMSYADRWWITYNGELYNFRELRRELEADGERFATSCDTEVLLRHVRAARARRCSSGSTASSRSPSGTTRSAGSSWRATASASSRSTTRRRATASRSRPSSSRSCRCSARRRLDERGARSTSSRFLWVPDPQDGVPRRAQAAARPLRLVRRDGELQVEQYWDLRFEPEERSEDEWRDAVREEVQAATAAPARQRRARSAAS